MKLSGVLATLAALVVFFALCWLFSGAPDNAGLLATLNPVAAVSGLAFALAFAAGLPVSVAIIVALALLLIIPLLVWLALHRLAGR
ncbi:hypothetical protein [Oceanisphaera avium]|uniref:Uncharacterized protein n=1 Tax=Oceanisphaera avium TaxID=1903694 RepID=A0A1Y0CX03_9GAMM|nr:hypothetical protein [Oceanisphaera avium]ART79534.1 hypothetical protein CBP12_04700 [Oceanisphaera avium]